MTVSVIVIELTLLDVSPDVNEDLNGKRFPHVADATLSSCSTAAKILEAKRWRNSCLHSILGCRENRPLLSSKDEDVKDGLLRSVDKYLKVPDKYMALTSLLLKSQAFYLMHGLMFMLQEQELPIVNLPRTHRGKPFVPTTVYAMEGESNTHPLSVSHQFPFCGIARVVKETTALKLGMDIVVFDDFNRQVHDSVEDFVKVFREMFTDWEWRRIHSTHTEQHVMIEFYLRWAMKEAYTKALGVGLHLNFAAFETRLDIVDVHGSDSGVWSAVSVSNTGTHLRGSVVTNAKDETSWDFYFFPLFAVTENSRQAKGCACVCFGPLRDNDTTCAFEAQITWTNIQNLIQWHQER
jgi:phosphopantetheine--protein transferase-like protein